MVKRIFIGQRVTGENEEKIRDETKKIKNILEKLGYEIYSTMEGEYSFKKAGEWVIHAFKEIDKCDIFLAIIRGEEKSEGLLMEIGYVLAKNKKLILAINKNVKKTYLRDMAENIMEFDDIDDLLNKLKELK